MARGQYHQSQGTIPVNLTGNTGLVGQMTDQCGNFEPVEDIDAATTRSRDQVATDHYHQHQHIEAKMPCMRSQFFPTATLRCGDRKSTRLNSSHVRISYAVFCLKQK